MLGDGAAMRARVDLQPLAAFGYGFSPSAYVSVLFGVALGRVNLPPGGDNDDETVVSFVAGLGGNLDFISLLTK